MKNKIELKKFIIICIIVIICFTGLGVYINYLEYKNYTSNFNSKIYKILENVIENNPDIDKNQMMEIINSDITIDKDFLKEYGIDINKDSVIKENDELYMKYFLIYSSLIFILGIGLLTIFIKYDLNKDKKIDEITKYIEQINNRNYKLNIDDNTEDELSILKNEIYKTTVMLKEIAENSLNDKHSLKNSLSDISHQLKTPLTSIIIMLDNILENEDMDENTKKEFMQDIKREISNIKFLVESLLKLSKFDNNSVSFINKEISVKKIISEAIKNVSSISDLKSITIEYKLNKEDEFDIVCDEKWQIEAITNILKNSVEHSKIGSSIRIIVEDNDIYSMIAIKDFGTGIAEKELSHIFERFYKGKNSSNESIGIGLALAKSIVENNKGFIEVESEIGVGTCFKIKYLKSNINGLHN